MKEIDVSKLTPCAWLAYLSKHHNLPESIRQRLMYACISSNIRFYDKYNERILTAINIADTSISSKIPILANIINQLFHWDCTNEGFNWWCQLYDKLDNADISYMIPGRNKELLKLFEI